MPMTENIALATPLSSSTPMNTTDHLLMQNCCSSCAPPNTYGTHIQGLNGFLKMLTAVLQVLMAQIDRAWAFGQCLHCGGLTMFKIIQALTNKLHSKVVALEW